MYKKFLLYLFFVLFGVQYSFSMLEKSCFCADRVEKNKGEALRKLKLQRLKVLLRKIEKEEREAREVNSYFEISSDGQVVPLSKL